MVLDHLDITVGPCRESWSLGVGVEVMKTAFNLYKESFTLLLLSYDRSKKYLFNKTLIKLFIQTN